MAQTYVYKNGTGNVATTFPFTFPYLKEADVKVEVLESGAWVTKTKDTHYEFSNATTLKFLSGQVPVSGTNNIKLSRSTDADKLTATFYPGSAIRSVDLNDNFTQNLYSTEEAKETAEAAFQIDGSSVMTGNIIFEGATANDYETTLTVTDPTADRTITLPNVTGTVITTGDTNTVTSTILAANSVDSDQYVNGSILTEHIADNNITTAKIAPANVTEAKLANNAVATAKIANDAIDGTKIADNAIDSEHYTDGSIDKVHLAADIIDGTKIADDAINSEHYAAGSIDLEHMSANSVDSDQYVNGSIDAVHIADDQVDSQHYVAGSIDLEHMSADSVGSTQYVNASILTEHIAANNVLSANIAPANVTVAELANNAVETAKIAANAVTQAKLANDCIQGGQIADDAVNSEHYAAASVLTEHIADNNVTADNIGPAAVTEAKLANNSVAIAKIGCEQTTLTDSDSHVPTSGAVVDYVAGQLAPIGGFEAIATEVAFPATASQPASGVIISISDAAGVVVNGSGVSTTGRTTDGTPATVTINNFPSSLYSETLAAGVGLMVSSTGSSNTYNYHKVLAAEGDVKQLSDDINDFNARYRVNAGEPSSANDEGDLVFDTNANKMKVYDGSSWGEVTSSGDFKYLYLCPAGGTGAPTINGSIATYDLREGSNSGSAASVTSAAQLMVSVNGVTQQPNTGTSAPALGFALVDSNTIIFGANLPTSAEVFIVQFGSALTINTPGDGTVTTAKIASAAVTTAKIADDAVDGAKLANNIDIAGTLDVTGATTLDSTVGIGTSSPSSYDGEADDLVVVTSDHTGLTVASSGTDKRCNLYFSDGTSGTQKYIGGFSYDHSNDSLLTRTGGSERMRITSDGTTLIGANDINWGSATATGIGLYPAAATNWIGIKNSSSATLTNTAFQINHGTDVTTSIRNNGKASFAGTAFVIEDDGEISTNIHSHGHLKLDSGADFGDSTTNIFLNASTGAATYRGALAVDRAVSGDGCFHASLNGTVKAAITSAGAATFASTVKVGDVANYSAAARLEVVGEATTTNDLIPSIIVNSKTTGTAANGVGTSMIFLGSMTGQNNVELGHIGFHNSGVAGAYGDFVVKTRPNGTSLERMRITSGGDTYLGLSSATAYVKVTNSGHIHSRMNNNNTAGAFFAGYDSGNSQNNAIIWSNGSYESRTNSYGGISDVKLKENIVDTGSQWNDIKNLKVKNFNFIKGDTTKQIGLIAQEVETVSPGLVFDIPDIDEDGEDLGTTTKSIKYSVLYMKAVKALQEAMTKIETLETKVTALEAK